MTRIFLSLIISIPLLVRLCTTDIKSREVENAAALGLSLCAFGYESSLKLRILSALLGFAAYPFFGFGDVLMFCSLGFAAGPKGLIFTFCCSSVLGGLYALALVCTKIAKRKDSFPFAPFIAASFLIFTIREIASMM